AVCPDVLREIVARQQAHSFPPSPAAAPSGRLLPLVDTIGLPKDWQDAIRRAGERTVVRRRPRTAPTSAEFRVKAVEKMRTTVCECLPQRGARYRSRPARRH